jgi:hypothetical protein
LMHGPLTVTLEADRAVSAMSRDGGAMATPVSRQAVGTS